MPRTLAGLVAGVLLVALCVPVATAAQGAPPSYRNPLRPKAPHGTVDNCPDPSVLHGRGSSRGRWYIYCTSDPLNDHDTRHGLTFNRLPMLSSTDLVHWRYVGPSLPAAPRWAAKGAKLWAPDVTYSTKYRRYYMTYSVTDVDSTISHQPHCDKDFAIGLAVSLKPTGPWHARSRPLVPPRRLGRGCDFAAVIDPDLPRMSVTNRTVLYWGSYAGGIRAQRLRFSARNARLVGRPRQLTVARKYEGADVVPRGRWYYLVASSASCCNGPLSGYGAFVGRSRSPFGPFLDRDGVPMSASRAGGTPVLAANGNRWVGPGHTSIFRDSGGQTWMAYHAVSRAYPFFATRPGFTRRPLMLDPVDWVGGWPTVRSGRGPSEGRMPGPAAHSGQRSRYRPSPVRPDVLGASLPDRSDSFSGSSLSSQWTWIRPPSPSDYSVADGSLNVTMRDTQLVDDTDDASVLTEPAPQGNYVVDAKVTTDVPYRGVFPGSPQGALLIYRNDDDYLKLSSVAAGETRQTAFAREVPKGRSGYPRYGSSSVGPPGRTTYLRIVKRTSGRATVLRAYTSRDGVSWSRGTTWRADEFATHARIGLVSMSGSGFTASFDYVHVHALTS